MKPNTPGFIGERLTQARRSIGLNGIGLAGLLGVSATTISQYEKNKQSPRPEVMDKICDKLNLSRSFFLRPINDRGARRIRYRSLSAATKSARDRAEVRFDWTREIVEYLAEKFDFPKLNLPQVELPSDFRSFTSELIEEAAMSCRQLWGFDVRPIPDVVLALESNGIIVIRGALGAETLDAFSEQLPDDFAYIFLGSDKGLCARSRFDAAHELGHLILHKNVDQKDFRNPSDFKILESQAHRFAASFLLPASSFLKSLWAPTLDAFRVQKETWNVSIKGMIVRARQLRLLDAQQYQRMMINYARRFRNGEPGDEKELERPRLVPRCFDALVSGRVRTKAQLLAEIALSPNDIEELAGLHRGFFSGFLGEVIQMPVLKKQPSQQTEGGDSVSADIISIRSAS